MCCGKSSSQAIYNSAYIKVRFTNDVVEYRGIVTNQLYGDFLTGEETSVKVVDFDNSNMIQLG